MRPPAIGNQQRAAWLDLPRAVRRFRLGLRRAVARSRRNSRHVSLGTRLLLVLVAVSTTSTLVTVLLQDSSLSADLRRAAEVTLARAADTTEQLLEEHLTSQFLRYRAVAASPQFVANVEAEHAPTLQHFAQDLAQLHGAAAVMFVGVDGREVAAAGGQDLRRTILERSTARWAPSRRDDADPPPVLLVYHGVLHGGVSVPVTVDGRRHGDLVAFESIDATRFAAWSRMSGAMVAVARAGADDDSARCVRPLGEFELRVTISLAAAEDALANSRGNLLKGGLIGLGLALLASVFLARSLARPIRTIQLATGRIRSGDLRFRLDDARSDEVGDVARAINLMLESLERNVDDRIRVEKQITHLSCHDGLTGLGNRRLLRNHLGQAIELACRERTSVGVVYVDLDRFKDINDTLGHTAGDELLVQVAHRLEDCMRARTRDPLAGDPLGGEELAMLARLGSDEFAIVFAGVDDRLQVEQFADRVLQALATPFQLRGQVVTVSASLGIAISPDDAVDAEALLRDADLAMCQAKAQGGSRYEFYADSMQEIAARRLALDSQLRRALAGDEFELFYQPKLQLHSGAVTGVEALLRWRNEGQGIVGPAEFIPLAEETGAIIAIGDWVLRTAMLQALQWQADGLRPIRVAVNVSVRQIEHRDDFVAKVAALLAETGLDPGLLELEITEGVLLEDPESAISMFERLRAMGVSIALDDFGTGYSSLSQLRLLPIDTLKLDRSFIRGADSNPEAAAVVGSIIAMAKVLGMLVVVEGVETRAQRRLLEELGCDEIQGYLLRQPMAEVEASAYLRRRRLAKLVHRLRPRPDWPQSTGAAR